MGMSVPKCLFFQDLEGLTEVFGGMSAGMSGRKLPLWAEFFVPDFKHKLLEQPPGVRGHPSKNARDIPDSLSSKPKEDKLSRESTKFLATTPSRVRPPTPPSGLRTQKT